MVVPKMVRYNILLKRLVFKEKTPEKQKKPQKTTVSVVSDMRSTEKTSPRDQG